MTHGARLNVSKLRIQKKIKAEDSGQKTGITNQNNTVTKLNIYLMTPIHLLVEETIIMTHYCDSNSWYLIYTIFNDIQE